MIECLHAYLHEVGRITQDLGIGLQIGGYPPPDKEVALLPPPLILISIATVFPFLFMAFTSFTESFTMMTYPDPSRSLSGQLR